MPQYPTEYPATYCIRVRGHLGQEWADWFEGLSLSVDESGETRLQGPLADQAALHGVLTKLRDLGLPLIAVNQEEAQ
jgi:hypothetical protein